MDYLEQFEYTKEDYLAKHFDFIDWYVLFHVFQDAIKIKPRSILEIGVGNGILEGLLGSRVGHYVTLDINGRLEPDVVEDLRCHCPSLVDMYDLVVCTQVLEHIDFDDVPQCLHNIYSYLKKGGRLMITLPHQKLYFMWLIPTNKPHVITMPRLFLKRTMDIHHKWEIGRGVSKDKLEKEFSNAGFHWHGYKKLLYEDYWLLEKST